MLVDFEDIFSLNVTIMSLGLDATTDTSVGGALSSAMALCSVTVLLKVSVISHRSTDTLKMTYLQPFCVYHLTMNTPIDAEQVIR